MNALKISKGAASLTNDFERKWGKWDIFGDGDLLADSATNAIIPGGCYGGPQETGGPYIEIFGGEGSGATAEAIMGYFVENTEGLGGVLGGVQRTGSILGAKMTNFGSGSRYPPMVNFRDKCNLGFGGVGKAILGGPNGDQVVAIVMLSTGEGYPELPPVATPISDGITNVIVANPGTGYQPGDRVVFGISPGGIMPST